MYSPLNVTVSPTWRALALMKLQAERRFQETGLANGLVFYSALYGARRRPVVSRGLPMWVSPPFVINEDQLEDMMDRVDRTLHQWEQSLMADLEAPTA